MEKFLQSIPQGIQESLMQALKVKDIYTYHHCFRVAEYAEKLARASGASNKIQTLAKYGGLFHDLGKIGIPDAILKKPGKLSSEEYRVMETHPVMSFEILQPLECYQEILEGVLHHHERMDGKGYPDQLKGEAIPITARMILIADAFDAITSLRPYHQPAAQEVAFERLRGGAGTQFDPRLVEIFIRAWK